MRILLSIFYALTSLSYYKRTVSAEVCFLFPSQCLVAGSSHSGKDEEFFPGLFYKGCYPFHGHAVPTPLRLPQAVSPCLVARVKIFPH